MEWFNAVDATYRTDLKELNNTNFARFEAKLDQRIAESESHLEQRIAAVRVDVAAGIAELKSNLITWMVGLWLTSMLSIAGLFVAVLRTR